MNLISKTFTITLLSFLVACDQQSGNTEETEVASEKEMITEEVMVINANLASQEELTEAGLSESLADQVMEQRPFLDPMQFHSLLKNEIDSVELEQLYRKVFVPFNLNTTSEADFKIIPGVGDRMAHEFIEYRPYTNIKQFRKEIGKYVDEEEVARYEQYIFVPIELNTATEEDMLILPGVGKRMAHEFEEYRPYKNIEQFRKEIGKYVDDKELLRLERLVYLK